MSPLLNFVENELQLIALSFMGMVYILRLRWLLSFKAGRERQAPTGSPETSQVKGILYSWANIASPWAMESTRLKPFFYAQFVIFHLGVAAGIGLSFVIPYAPGVLQNSWVVGIFQGIMICAAAVGAYRLYRRLSHPAVRLISTPDDIFSLSLLIVWLGFAAWAAPNRPDLGEEKLLIYFILTTFFLIYVPFSKISHYLYYPFTRYYFGRSMGHRGVYPVKRVPQPKPAKI